MGSGYKIQSQIQIFRQTHFGDCMNLDFGLGPSLILGGSRGWCWNLQKVGTVDVTSKQKLNWSSECAECDVFAAVVCAGKA